MNIFETLVYVCLQIKIVEKIISEADHKTGEAKCKYYAGRISFLYEEEVRITICNSLTAFCKTLSIFLT